MYQVVEKLKGCRGSLIVWSKVKFGELASTIKAKRVQLQNLLLEFPGCDTLELWKLQDELNDLLEKEEVYWQECSRVSWMKEGDKNTKIFHAQCNERRQQNFTKGLRDEHGVWQTDKSWVADIAIDYFQKIFTSSAPQLSSIDACLEGMGTVISEDMNAQFLENFTSAEVSEALKQMYPTKAPGPDCKSTIFYQTYWDIVGDKS